MFTNLTIKNFRSIRGEVSFPLTGRGLMLLNGEHNCDYGDSNGAGKSSVYLAMLWCLFGHTGDQKINELVNRHCDKCKVQIDFTKAGNRYSVIRERNNAGRGSTTLTFLENEAPREDVGKNVAAIESDIKRVLGIAKDAFLFTLISDGSSNFAQLSDEKQKQLLEALLEFDVSQFRGQTSSTTRDINNRLYELNVALEVGNQTSSISEEMLTTAKDRVSRAQLAYDQQINMPDSQKYSQQITNLTEELNRIDGGYYSQQSHEREQIAYCDKITQWLQHKQQELNTAKLHIEGITAKEELAEQEYNKATAAESCTSCGRPHTADSKAFYFAEAAAAWKNRKSQLEQERNAQEVRVNNIAKDLYKANYVQPENLYGDWADVFNGWLDKKNAHQSKINELDRERLDRRKAMQDQLDAANRALGEAKAKKEQVSTELDNAKYDLKKLQDSHKAQMQTIDLVAAAEEKEQLQRESRILEEVEKALRKNGLPSYIIETQLPAIERLANQYLSKLSPSALTISLEINQGEGRNQGSLNVGATNEEGAQTYSGLSKGEQERINIAMLLALRKVVVDNHCDPGILFLDELIDGLDNTGIENIVCFLQEMSADTQIVCISHNQAMKALFPDVITIRRSEGMQTTIDNTQLVHYGA